MFRNYNGKVVEFRGNQEVVYKHLKKNHRLTALEALGVYGIYRLAPRVCELRAKGVPIKSTYATDERGRTYVEYTIDPLWKNMKELGPREQWYRRNPTIKDTVCKFITGRDSILV